MKSICYTNSLKSRKWQLTLLITVVSSVLCWFGKISGGEWTSAILTISILYPIGNIASASLGAFSIVTQQKQIAK